MTEHLDLKKSAIETLPVVSSVRFHTGDKTHKTGYHVNLRCVCGAKQVGPIRISSKFPTLCDCLRELGQRIERDHGPTCVAAAQKLQKDATDASTKRPSSFFFFLLVWKRRRSCKGDEAPSWLLRSPSADEAAASFNANDVLMLHRSLKMIQQPAPEANKGVLEEEKERDELHNQIEQIEEQYGSRYCCEGAEEGQTWRVGIHTGSRSVVN
jgi:hypothetical protein